MQLNIRQQLCVQGGNPSFEGPCLLMVYRGVLAGRNAEDSMAVLARHSARFDVLQVQLDPITGKHLAVAGLRTVQVSNHPLLMVGMLLESHPHYKTQTTSHR